MFDKHIIAFNKNILGLREFVDLIDPILTKKHQEYNQHIEKLIIRKAISERLESKSDWKENEKESMQNLFSKLNQEISSTYNKPVDVIIEKLPGSTGEEAKLKFMMRSQDEKFNLHLEKINVTRSHIELLYQ